MNKFKNILLLSILFLIITGLAYKTRQTENKGIQIPYIPYTSASLTPTQKEQINSPKTAIIAQNLDTPWGIVFLPDKSILVTERAGRIKLIDSNGSLEEKPVAVIDSVIEIGEGGLLGVALHPNFSANRYIYFYYTYEGNDNKTQNKVVRMTYIDKKFKEEKVIVDKIPGAPNHNGGRIKFGPDNFLYITTGDAQNPSLAQDTTSLAGKILRVTDEGKPVSDNPFGNIIFSYGHRNSQGLAWDENGRLWATEHGRSGILSGLDEINLIDPGKNYGWPIIQGDEKKDGMESPRLHSGSNTWAPAGAVFIGNSIIFGGLRGKALYQAVIDGDNIKLKEHFKSEFGRIREVILGPDGYLYITTSNRDGRGTPKSGDDKIIKIDINQI